MVALVFSLITAICFTTLEPVSKLIANQIDPYAITAIRFLIGSVVLLPFSIRRIIKDRLRLSWKDYLIISGLGVLVICISMVFLQIAVKEADNPSIVAIIFSANSISTLIFSALILKTKITKIKVVGIAICMIGVLAMVDFSSGTNLSSVLYAVLAALTFSIYTVLCKKFMTKIPGDVQTGISFFAGSIVLIVILLLSGKQVFTSITSDTLLPIAYLSVVVTAIGYWAYFKAIKIGGAQIAAIAFLIKPCLTPFATFFINGEKPGIKIIIGLILVFVGAVLASREFKKKEKIAK